MTDHVIHEMLLENHCTDGLRSGEGCVVECRDGRLCIIYGDFQGPSDHAQASLLKRYSPDGGVSWTEPEVVLRTPPGGLNVMSVSLLRLADGRIGCVYLDKRSTDDCRPRFMASTDETRSWSEPELMVQRPGYYVVNNDRLVQLSTGRLLAPYAYYEPGQIVRRTEEGSPCGCLLSDDGGATWRLGKRELRIQPDHVLRPKLVREGDAATGEFLARKRIVAQEPGVIELGDGRVMMWVRTTGGYAYRCYSTDGGDTWSPLQAITEFAMPCGPQSIWRLPGEERLIMLYNDRQGVPFGAPEFMWRTPLSVAASDDEGANWQRHAPLEVDDSVNYCYFSLCFSGERAVCTYYQGVSTVEEGVERRRNLHSLKVKVVATDFFRG
jgi:sialidase-1